MHIQVECYAGYRGEEIPRFIRMAKNKIKVKEIVDRWIAPDHRYFKLIGEDDATYIVRHETATWQWELVFYQTAQKITGELSKSGEG